jgi:hypothetical protein
MDQRKDASEFTKAANAKLLEFNVVEPRGKRSGTVW